MSVVDTNSPLLDSNQRALDIRRAAVNAWIRRVPFDVGYYHQLRIDEVNRELDGGQTGQPSEGTASGASGGSDANAESDFQI